MIKKKIFAIAAAVTMSLTLVGCTLTPFQIMDGDGMVHEDPTATQTPDPVKPEGSSNGNENGNPDITNPDNNNPENEVDNDAIIDAFINGEGKAKFDHVIADEDTYYTLDEMVIARGDVLLNDYFGALESEMTSSYKVAVNYAYIDCGNDGIPEMALQVTGNTAEQDNEIQDYYIVKKLNGELCVVDQYESFYRSFGELNKYGVFCLSGSGGASLSYVSYERINAEGEHEFIYSDETEYAMADTVIYGIELPSDADLPDAYPQLPDSTGNGEIIRDKFSFAPTELTFVDGSPEFDAYLRQLAYVFHDQNGNVIYPNSEYSEIYSDLGIVVTDDAGSKQMINDRIASLGISEEEMYMLHSTPDSVPDWKVAWDGLEPQPLE